MEIFIENICKKAPRKQKDIVNKDTITTIRIRFLYMGNKGKHLLKQCILNKLKYNCTTDIELVILYNNKTSCYCTVREKISIVQRSSVIYKITYPGCLRHYVGKADRCFHIGKNEHDRNPDPSMHRHPTNCYFQELG